MSIDKVIIKTTSFFLILFVLFTVLPVKLNYSSFTIIILMVLSIVNLFYSKNSVFKPIRYYIFIISIPFVVYLLGFINTSNTNYGFTFLIKNMSFLAFPCIFFSLGKYINQEKVFKAFLFGLLLTNLYLIYLFFYYFNFGLKFYKIVTHDIYHSTYLGMYNLLAFWICFTYFIRESKKTYLLLGAFFLIAAILTSARIIYILSILSIGIAILFIIKSKLKRVITLIFISTMGVVLILTIPSFKQKFSQFLEIEKIGFDRNNYRSISSRFGKIEASLKTLEKNVWFGTGTGDLKDELVKEYKKMDFVMGYKYRYNPHNQYLENLTRNGIIGGVICLLTIYILPMVISIRRKKVLLFAFIFIVSGVSLTESILDTHKGITFYVFFSALIMNSINKDKIYSPSNSSIQIS